MIIGIISGRGYSYESNDLVLFLSEKKKQTNTYIHIDCRTVHIIRCLMVLYRWSLEYWKDTANDAFGQIHNFKSAI